MSGRVKRASDLVLARPLKESILLCEPAARNLWQEHLQAEATTTGFLELGRFHDHRLQSLLAKNRFPPGRHAGRDVAVSGVLYGFF